MHKDCWFTPNEVANILDVRPATVRNWIRKGFIPALVLPSGRYKIPRYALQEVLEVLEG